MLTNRQIRKLGIVVPLEGSTKYYAFILNLESQLGRKLYRDELRFLSKCSNVEHGLVKGSPNKCKSPSLAAMRAKDSAKRAYVMGMHPKRR